MSQMVPWIETGGVVLLAALGVGGGYLFSRLKGPYWTLGYALPMVFVCAFGVARYVHSLAFVPPFSWITAGRVEFVLFAPACTMLFVTLLPRVPQRRQRGLILVLTGVLVLVVSVLPFVVPALLLDTHAKLYTTIDRNGICLQSTDYTCGPAASVTGLRVLGVHAGEGELAVAMSTSSLTGTDPDTLATALTERYGPQGLSCRFRYFRGIQELREAGIVVAVVKFGFLVDHYVTVMQVTEDQVIVGDPVAGMQALSYEEFEQKWRSCGIVLSRAGREKG